jgi:hypothetical protein
MSSKARLVITAVTVENRSVAEVVRDYGVSRSWVYELLARHREEGEAAFVPRSRRPRTSPRATAAAMVELVLRLRRQLTEQGLDAGADTIAWHLRHCHATVLSRATINRVLTWHGAVLAQPAKRPKSSYIRFEAAQPNECWQSDFTHHRLIRPDGRPGSDVEIITWLDDHSRYGLHVSAHRRITAAIVADTFGKAAAHHGFPASTLTDMAWSTPCAGLPTRRAHRLGNRAAATGNHAEKLPPQPPHHLRQGRTLPVRHEAPGCIPGPAGRDSKGGSWV